MGSDDLDGAIERSHAALREIARGNTPLYEALFSQREDVTLGNPFGPFARGREAVVATMARAASNYRDGDVVGFEPVAKYVTEQLACIVEVEHFQSKVGGSDDLATISLRVTSVFEPEDGIWKLVHRHADPITTAQAPESVIQK